MNALRSKEDFWLSVKENWGRFEELLEVSGIPDVKVKELIEREAQFGRGSRLIAQGFKGREDMLLTDALCSMRDKQDPRFWYFCQSFWQDAPDHAKIHTWPMWGLFCDWCSEGPEALGFRDFETQEAFMEYVERTYAT